MFTTEQQEQIQRLHEWQARALPPDGCEPRPNSGPAPEFTGDWSGAASPEWDTDLRRADFRKVAALSGADLRGADLRGANFTGQWMDDVSLRETDLRDATLTGIQGLSVEQLAGADLRAAALPEDLGKFTQLDGVAAASQYLQSVYRLLLLLCGFAALAVLSFRDENLVLHDGGSATPLPLLQVEVSPQVFSYVVPGLVLLLYAYQGLSTVSLWRLISFLPAYFPDGEPLDRRAHPSMVNIFIRYSLRRIKNERNDELNFVLHWLMSFAVPPLTLVIVWMAGLKKHDWLLSLYHGTLLGLATFLAAGLLVLSVSIIRNEWNVKDVSFKTFLRTRPRCLALVGIVVVTAVVWIVLAMVDVWTPDIVPLGLALAVVGFGASEVRSWMRETRYSEATASLLLYCAALTIATFCISLSMFAGRNYELKRLTVAKDSGANDTFPSTARWSPVLWMLSHSLLNPFIDFRNKVVSKRPDGWKGTGAAENDQISLVVGADLERVDLRSMDGERAFLGEANLRGADLRGAYLRFAYLRFADLSHARLDGAYIRGANFRDVILHGVDLGRVIFSSDLNDPTLKIGPNFQGVRVNYRELKPKVIAMLADQQVNNLALVYWSISDKDLKDSPNHPVLQAITKIGLPLLTDAEIGKQKMPDGTVFPRALPMAGADLSGFILRGARFDGVDMDSSLCVGADLRGASFAGADVSGTDFTGAILDDADFTGANVAGATFTHSTWFNARGGLEGRGDQIMAIEGHAPIKAEAKK